MILARLALVTAFAGALAVGCGGGEGRGLRAGSPRRQRWEGEFDFNDDGIDEPAFFTLELQRT